MSRSEQRSTSKKSRDDVKYVLLRLPKNTTVSDLDGMEITLDDLKITSDKGFSAVPDFATIPERGSACPLVTDGDVLKCVGPFMAHIQLVQDEEPRLKKKKTSISNETPVVKRDTSRKPKKQVKEQDSD